MILQFVDEALGDFPDLRTENISVKKYGGKIYAHTFGIEFTPTKHVTISYSPISHLEDTL